MQANTAMRKKQEGDDDERRAQAQQSEMDRHYFEAEATKQQRLGQMRKEICTKWCKLSVYQADKYQCTYPGFIGNR